MSKHLRRAQLVQGAIRGVLLREWDPIGIADVPEAQDEYDSYVPQIYGLLIRRENRQKLVDYLWWAETENMGLCGNYRRTERIADLLLQLSQESPSNS